MHVHFRPAGNQQQPSPRHHTPHPILVLEHTAAAAAEGCGNNKASTYTIQLRGLYMVGFLCEVVLSRLLALSRKITQVRMCTRQAIQIAASTRGTIQAQHEHSKNALKLEAHSNFNPYKTQQNSMPLPHPPYAVPAASPVAAHCVVPTATVQARLSQAQACNRPNVSPQLLTWQRQVK
jgi:hypothetical protein